MSYMLWLYQTQGLFVVWAPDTDVTDNIYGDYSWTVGHEKKELD